MAWQTHKDGNGRDWNCWQQELGSTCGPACVLTVAGIMGKQGGHDEASVRALVDKANPALRDFSGRHNWKSSGSEAAALVDVLSNTFKIRNAHTVNLGEARPEVGKTLDLLTTCDYTHPGIAYVGWSGSNSGHWVVVCGALEGNPNKILVLDPLKGSGLLEVSTSALPDYNSPKGGVGQFSYCVVTTR